MTSVLTIGNFDGVHVGHQAIVQRARTLADAQGAQVVALTFDPHPAAVLRPDAVPPRLCTIDEKVRRLEAAGVDRVELLEPTPALLGLEPAAFVDWALVEYAPVAFVEGPDFRFGKRRAGDLARLRALGAERGFDVVAAQDVEVVLGNQHVAPASSSLTRWLIGRGRVVDAARCLGRPYTLRATVTRGEQRGRTIGIPTANLDTAEITDHILPADGVYAGWASFDPPGGGPSQRFPAAISVGVKPTFGHKRLTIEGHLLDFQPEHPDSLYGTRLTLAFEQWVRDQYPFPSVEVLRAQLKRDLEIVRHGYSAARVCR